MREQVAPDGSPVAVYLAAAPGETAAIAHAVRPPPGSVLELGCGVGRETRGLVACGYDVTAVDESEEMLEHVTGVRKVAADLFGLDLYRPFDLVIAGSHFVDDADPERRAELYAVCARHVARHGAVLLERYDPEWVRDPEPYSGRQGLVDIDFEVRGRRDDGAVEAALTYRLSGTTWRQEFAFVAATQELVAAEAQAHGLRLVDVLGDDDSWLVLELDR